MPSPKNDPNASSRKKDHIDLAFRSSVMKEEMDNRFYYEPLLSAHPNKYTHIGNYFLDKEFKAPIWVSSMTGGTELAGKINRNLAKACNEFGMGMGLGSCRMLLDDNEYLEDFAVRKYIGDQPLYANLGIAQLEQLCQRKQLLKIENLLAKLEADGLIIHINPLQEWLQPEGDYIKNAPIQTIIQLMEEMDIKLIVKEVGQGMGYHSLKCLIQMPLEAIEFAAHGGTNFSKLELLRSSEDNRSLYEQLSFVGHTVSDMVDITNRIIAENKGNSKCKQFIISGGVKNFLDGFYYREKLNANCVYGQASKFLQYAKENYEALQSYVHAQIEGYKLAQSFLKLRN